MKKSDTGADRGASRGREETTRGIRDRQEARDPGIPLTLKLIAGPDMGRVFEIPQNDRAVRIGREPDNDLVLSDPTASRYHVEIRKRSEGYLLKDLSSTNGTLLDGVRVREVFVDLGACVRIGTTEIKLVRTGAESEGPVESELAGLYGRSEKMREVFRLIRKIAPTSLTTLITGETGTGKELVARAIHKLGSRSEAPFIVFDCSAVPEELMENELYGHERGAFTGALNLKQGVFELGHGGTVFLDEVGELSLQQQPKLLRFLERQEIRRLGSTQTVAIDARIVAATNRYLDELTAAGRFREDLFFRLSVVQIHLPPLRERKDDIPLLLERFLQKGATAGRIKRFSGAALDLMTRYDWPGNVRELRHLVDRAALLTEGETVEASDIASYLRGMGNKTSPDPESLADLEKIAILKALDACGGNKTAAAKRLGIASSTLYEKLKKYEQAE